LVGAAKQLVNSKEIFLSTVILTNILTSTYFHKERTTAVDLSDHRSDQHTQGTRRLTNEQKNSTAKYNTNHDQMTQEPTIYSHVYQTLSKQASYIHQTPQRKAKHIHNRQTHLLVREDVT
jgi:type II secretory ATPase GspE/PulE/Tfp pilus assembly ATPase PilB-like protein